VAEWFKAAVLKSDDGGLMSGGLLFFGITTLWLPAARAALFVRPLATGSVLLCLALITKFTREAGMTGMVTGGVLGLNLISVIVADTTPQQIARNPQLASPTSAPVATPARQAALPTAPQLQRQTTAVTSPPPQAPLPPEERTPIASDGAVLKFSSGIHTVKL
jgi:cell division septation protein DedD